MKIRIPSAWGELSGWLFGAFLIGIGLHSVEPSMPWQQWVIFLFLCGPVILWSFLPRSCDPRVRPACLLFIACVLGVWRFDQTITRTGRHFSSWQTARWVLGGSSPADIPFLSHLRDGLTSRIHAALPPAEASLVSGMLYGDQAFSPEVKDVFRRAGLMHLVAVSGSNVTIVVTVLSAALVGAGLRRRMSFVGLTCGIAAFAIFAGSSASVLRAAIMGWLVLCAREFGRLPRTRRLLLVAASVLAALTPTLLAFDAGYALSFLATIGILEWTPHISARLTSVPERFGVRESLATTLGAMIMTIPYLAWAFGQLSLVGLVTNMLALPLVAWIMAFGAITAAWGNLPGAAFISAPALGAAKLILLIAHIVDVLPWLAYRVLPMHISFLFGAYLLLWRLHRLLAVHHGLSTRDGGDRPVVRAG